MAEVRFNVRFRDEDARGSIRSLQSSIDALRGDVNQLGVAFRSATAPATRFGTTVSGQLRSAEIASGGLLRNVRSLRTTLGGLFIGGGLALAVRSFARLNDEAINTQSLLRQITDTSGEFERSQARIYQLALDLRTPVAAISTLYTRTALALGDAYDPARVEQFTRSVAQLGRASGATQQEFVNATRQLTQGLGSGRLAGDELRGVLEGLPAVGRALADELGVAFGQLRQLGRTGQLTPAAVFGALSGEGVAATAEAAFGEVGLTFEQVFGNFTSALQLEFTKLEGNTELLDELNKTLQAFAPDVVKVGEAITQLVNTLGIIPSLATLIGLAAAPSAIGALSSRRRNIFGASQNVTALTERLRVSQGELDDIRRGVLTRSNYATNAVGPLRNASPRDFVALRSALTYLDRVGTGGGVLGARGFNYAAQNIGRTLTSGGPWPVRIVGFAGTAAAAFGAFNFIDDLENPQLSPVEALRRRLDRFERFSERDELPTLPGRASDEYLAQGRSSGSRLSDTERRRLRTLRGSSPAEDLAYAEETLRQAQVAFLLLGEDDLLRRAIEQYKEAATEAGSLLGIASANKIEEEFEARFGTGLERAAAAGFASPEAFGGQNRFLAQTAASAAELNAEVFSEQLDRLVREAVGDIGYAGVIGGGDRELRRLTNRAEVDRDIIDLLAILRDPERLELHERFRALTEQQAERFFDNLSPRRIFDPERGFVEDPLNVQRNNVDTAIEAVDEFVRKNEELADRTRDIWIDTWADIGSSARSIFELLLEDSRAAYIQLGQELLRIFLRINVAQERITAAQQGTIVQPSFGAAFFRSFIGGVPIFHEGRIPTSFTDTRETLALVQNNEAILTPEQLRSVTGAGRASGATVNQYNMWQGDLDQSVLGVLERRNHEASAILNRGR